MFLGRMRASKIFLQISLLFLPCTVQAQGVLYPEKQKSAGQTACEAIRTETNLANLEKTRLEYEEGSAPWKCANDKINSLRVTDKAQKNSVAGTNIKAENKPKPSNSPTANNAELDYLLSQAIQNGYAGNIAETDKLVDRALQIDAKSAKAHNAKGLARLNSMVPFFSPNKAIIESAIEEFQKAIEIRPNYTAALYNLGYAHKWTGQFDKAFDAYSKAIAANPATTKASRGDRAEIARKSGKWDVAISDYKFLLQSGANWQDTTLALCETHAEKGDVDAALEFCNSALERNPKDFTLLKAKAEVLLNGGRLSEAIDVMNAAIKFDKKNWEARLVRAKAYLKLSRNSEALSDLADIYSQRDHLPGFGYFWQEPVRLYASTAYKVGDFEQAIEAWGYYVSEASNDDEFLAQGEAHYQLARAYAARSNDPNDGKAQEAIKKALAHNPAHAGANRLVRR